MFYSVAFSCFACFYGTVVDPSDLFMLKCIVHMRRCIHNAWCTYKCVSTQVHLSVVVQRPWHARGGLISTLGPGTVLSLGEVRRLLFLLHCILWSRSPMTF